MTAGNRAPPTKKVPQFKGNALIVAKRMLVERLGQAAYEHLLSQCNSVTQDVLGGVVLSNAWYPEAVFADLAEQTLLTLAPADYSTYCRETARLQMRSVYRFLLRYFVSLEKLSEHNHRLWSALHDSGELEAIHGKDGKSKTILIRDFDFITVGYEKAFTEYHCGILSLVGAKDPHGHRSRDNDGSYRFVFAWK